MRGASWTWLPTPPRPEMNDRRGTWRDASDARAAGPEASDPLVTAVGALIAFPAPPLPVAMYCWRGVTDGCGSTIVYLEDMFGFVMVIDKSWVTLEDVQVSVSHVRRGCFEFRLYMLCDLRQGRM